MQTGTAPSLREAEARAARRAGQQFGVISRAQAFTFGVTRTMIQTRLDAELWECVHPGVYRITAAPPSWRAMLMAACLAYGTDAAVSFRAAAALWLLPGFDEGPVEVTVPRCRGRVTGVIAHRITSIPPGDVTRIGAIRVTTAARTIIDIAGIAPESKVSEALDDALHRKIVRLDRLSERVDALAVKGRPGIALMRSLLDVRDAGNGISESRLESKALRLFRRSDLPDPAVQYEIWHGGRLIARPDLSYPELQLIIECDGRRWHTGANWARDLRRRNALTALGWTVLHVTWDDVERAPDMLVRTVRAAMARRANVSKLR